MEAKVNVKYLSFMNANFKEVLKKIDLVFFLVIALYFLTLIYCAHFFTWSDQYFYRLYYHGLDGRSLIEAYRTYPLTVGAREPIYFILSYVAHFFFSKQQFDFFLSISFLFVLLFFFYRSKTPKIFISLIITSVYFFSVFFITERLKLGTLFILLYFIFANHKNGAAFFFLAILSHAQLLILLPFIYSFSNFKINNKKTMFLLSAMLIAGSAFLFKHMMYKLPIYIHNFSFSNLVKPFFFVLITATFVEKEYWKNFICFYLPVLLVALLFGEGRMTLISFLGSIYFWSVQKKISVSFLLLLLSSCYFSVRGFVFLVSANIYGDGYALSILDFLKNILKVRFSF